MPKDLTSESFTKLLTALSSNEMEAAVVYTDLRDSLVKYFVLKGISEPDKSADETIDRIPERINQNTKPEDIKFIAFSIAKFIFFEELRKEQKQSNAANGYYSRFAAVKDINASDELDELRDCFGSLYKHEQELLLNYFADLPSGRIAENRQKIADREKVELNTLRNRVSRLRKRLEDCLGKKK